MPKNTKKAKDEKTPENEIIAENLDDNPAEELQKPENPQENAEEIPREIPNEPKVITSLVGNLSHALEEDAGEIDELFVQNQQNQPREYHYREKKPAKYRFFLIFGLLVFWLAIIGALSVIGTAREFVYDVTHQTALREEFERFIYPVVLNDPPEFTSPDNLQPSTVIASAIWQIILYGDTDNYEREMGMMTIPEMDVEAAARGIFGAGFEIHHRTIDYIVMEFTYLPESKSYIVPENPAYFTFLPRVADMSNSGDSYRLEVEYIAPTPMSIAEADYESEPVKTMIYTIIRLKDKTKVIESIELDSDSSQFGQDDEAPDFWEFSEIQE